MNYIGSTPAGDGFTMPGEFEQQQGTLMIWPERPGSWPNGAAAAKKVFTEIAGHIGETQTLYMLASEKAYREAEEMLKTAWPDSDIRVIRMETDDAWARDTGPTFVRNAEGLVRGINWSFNAWGGAVDGLYASWEKDDRVAAAFMEAVGTAGYDASPFVLEGGSIHSDGQGTLLTTESCLLSAGRNPGLTKQEIEEKLKSCLGIEKVIWLPRGIYNDETNEHVDNVCAFTSPGEVVLAWTDDENDPQYAMSKACLEVLERETDARGRHFRVRLLRIPEVPVTVTADDLKGYIFEEGEDVREEGERLAASYVNFYIANGQILLPQFGDVRDSEAVQVLSEAFPDRRIVPVYARDIIVGGGNIHCITQQIPAGQKERVRS